MKKTIFKYSLLLLTSILSAQTTEYRTSEDGLTKLINNPDFINDVVNLGKENLTLENLDAYFTKYVPEYSNFKIDKNKINFDNLYYVNSEGTSVDIVANQLSGLLKLNPAQAQSIENIFTGNVNNTLINNFSAGYGNLLFERGKDVKVDLAVDLAVDLFQSKLGDGGINSALIDIGGGLLGKLLLSSNKKEEAKMAEDAKLRIYANKLDDYNVYISNDQLITDIEKDQKDLYLHSKVKSKMPNNRGISVNYDEAINMLNEVINLYKQNPERASYLYLAYVRRGQCKMQKGAYRAAIIDYYYAQEVLKIILNGKLPDNLPKTNYPPGYHDLQNKDTYLKGTVTTTIGRFSQKDMAIIILNRAYAKYRLVDYKGAIADCKLALAVLDGESVPASGKPNDYKDIIQAIIAMSQFGLESYKDSYITFSAANLNYEISSNIIVLAEMEIFETNQYYGIPNYFHLDITQIKGLSYYKANKIKEAIATYESIVYAQYGGNVTTAGGDISTVYSTLGSFNFALGDKTKGISNLDEAIKINPYQLEYYFKRGTYKKALGQIKEANSDFEIVRKPESLNVIKKDQNYYHTKFTKFRSESNHAEVYNILKEGLTDYPEEISFFNLTLVHFQVSKSKSEAKDLADLLNPQDRNRHLLLSLYHEFSGNIQNAETEMQLAFDKGLGFYGYPSVFINLKEKPYYFKLFLKYGTKTNNNFIKKDLSEVEKSEIIVLNRESDSLAAIMLKNTGIKMDPKRLAMKNARDIGNIDEYLSLLNKIKDMTPEEVIDKIECLIILGKKKEAHDFAKKVIDKGIIKFLDIYDKGGSLQDFASKSFEW
jgi:hypothetical protein